MLDQFDTSCVEKMTTAEKVQDFILRKIISGAYGPNDHLSESRIIREFSSHYRISTISRAPIRAAFRNLEHAKFVITKPQVGTFVRELPQDEVLQLLQHRQVVEETIISRITTKRSRPDLAKAAQINGEIWKVILKAYGGELDLSTYKHANTETRISEADSRRIQTLDIAFHNELAVRSGGVYLSEVLQSIRERLKQIATPDFSLKDKHLRVVDIVSEHRAILDALNEEPPNTPWAIKVMQSHLATAARLWVPEKYRPQDRDFYSSLFDLPDVEQISEPVVSEAKIAETDDPGFKLSPLHLPLLPTLMMRAAAEVIVAVRLAQTREIPLDTVEDLLAEMKEIAYMVRNSSPDESNDKAVSTFLMLDMNAHLGMADLSGILSARETITLSWKEYFNRCSELKHSSPLLTSARMLEVCQEHKDILNALRPDLTYNRDAGPGEEIWSVTEVSIPQVVEFVTIHLWSAVSRRHQTANATNENSSRGESSAPQLTDQDLAEYEKFLQSLRDSAPRYVSQ